MSISGSSMEAVDELEAMVPGGATNNVAAVKRKRTKRPRQNKPTVTSSSSSSSSGEFSEEDEDLANCLILLAQGGALVGNEKLSSNPTNGKTDYYAYECKTCNKCFPSFQALGGHRASHKKPKMMAMTTMVVMEEEKKATEEVSCQIGNSPFSKPIMPPTLMRNNNNKSRVHECSICGSEFSSGQALGGHMRRHRSVMAPGSPKEPKKEKSLFSLDLNLPAPSDVNDCVDDYQNSTTPTAIFPFARKQSHELLFSSSPLVDCHY